MYNIRIIHTKQLVSCGPKHRHAEGLGSKILNDFIPLYKKIAVMP